MTNSKAAETVTVPKREWEALWLYFTSSEGITNADSADEDEKHQEGLRRALKLLAHIAATR